MWVHNKHYRKDNLLRNVNLFFKHSVHKQCPKFLCIIMSTLDKPSSQDEFSQLNSLIPMDTFMVVSDQIIQFRIILLKCKHDRYETIQQIVEFMLLHIKFQLKGFKYY